MDGGGGVVTWDMWAAGWFRKPYLVDCKVKKLAWTIVKGVGEATEVPMTQF